MRTQASISKLVPALALVLALAGCTPWSKSTNSSQGSSTATWFSNNAPPASAVAGASVPKDGLGNPQPSTMDKISQGFADAGNSVKKVFHRTSKKTPADSAAANDPVSLNSKAAKPSVDFYLSAARLDERGGNLQGAAEQCQRALELDPDNLAALLALARLYDRQGQLNDATKYYREAIRRHPQEPSAFNDLGLCYARQQRYAEAVEDLRKAVDLQPDKALYRNNLATVLVELGRTDEALAVLISIHGKTIAHYNVGFLLNKRGRKPAALEQFRLAYQSDPTFEAAKQWIVILSSPSAAESKDRGPLRSSAAGAGPMLGEASATSNADSAASSSPKTTSSPAPMIINGNPVDLPSSGSTGPSLGPKASSAQPGATEPNSTKPDNAAAPRYNEARREAADLFSASPAVPPTPDQVEDYSASRAKQAPIKPLPPVELPNYPTSRY